MTEAPLLARALLWAAQLLAPPADRSWIEAMRADLDVAHAEGRALSWAFGCLIAAARFRGAAITALTPRRRHAVVAVCLMLFLTGIYVCFFAIGGMRPHSAFGYLIVLAPIAGIVAPCVWIIRRGAPIVVNDRFVRRMLLLWGVVAAVLFGNAVRMLAGSSFEAIVAALSTVPLLDACSLATGTLASLATAILLGMNFRRLPPRIPRVLPFERRWVFVWGAGRREMLERVDAATPDMTFPRLWLLVFSVSPTLVLVQSGMQISLSANIGHGLSTMAAVACVIAAVACVANMLYIIAHVRFARYAR